MVYQLKTKEYYGNAKRVLKIIPSAIDSRDLSYLGDAMVLNMNTDECANGTTWKRHGNLLFITSDSMGALVGQVDSCEILVVSKGMVDNK